MRFRFSRPWHKYVAGASTLAGLFMAGVATVNAQENIRGVVRSQTTAPRGEIDGAVLDDGTVLHWPPHLEDEFAPVAGVGERVEATGQNETGPAGDEHFEVTKLTNTRNGAVVQNGERPRGAGRNAIRPGARPVEGVDTVEGKIRELTTAPRGEVDGAVLDTGKVLHWPPHLEKAFIQILAVGDRVKATGRTETAPRGEVQFEVQSVTNTRTGATAVNDDPGRRGPRRPVGARPAANIARSVNAEGVVRRVTTAPRGEVDGAILEDGTVLHWPPHLQDRYRDIAVVGNTVSASGRSESTPAGDSVLEVEHMTSAASGREPRGGTLEARIEQLLRQLRDIQQQLDDLRRD